MISSASHSGASPIKRGGLHPQHSAASLDSKTTGNDTQPMSVLQLQLFCQHPTVDFGSVSVGSHVTHILRAENPTLLNQHLSVDKVPLQDGFSLAADPSLPAAASLSWSSSVPPHSSVLVPITWRPTTAGAVSKLLVFKLDGKHRLQVKLLGKAVMQFSQQPHRSTDQSARHGMRHGSDAAAKKAGALSSSTNATSGSGAARPAGASAVQGITAPRPRSGGSSSMAPPSAAPGAARASKPAVSSQFKAPARTSAAAAGSLRLKARPAAAAAAAAAAAPPQGAGGGAISRPGSSVPATPRSVRSSMTMSAVAMTPAGRPGGSRPHSGGGGSSSSSMASACKAPSSTRKTFRFFHTELWMNKQDRAFTSWLNYLLLPFTPEHLRAASDGSTSVALSDLRLAARVQGAMVACYRTDEGLRATMIKVEESIDAGKLRMKPEVVLMEDLVLRRQALDVLMSYNPFWLRLALEVVTQKPVQPLAAPAAARADGSQAEAPRQTLFEAMRTFLLTHFMSDADMDAEMQAGRGAAHYDMQQYTRELGRLVLKRFLLLVLLLDKAATHLASSYRTPLLFKLTSSIKSSRQVVSEFLQQRLVGEGNVLRHLELLGYRLGYAQSPLLEYPFAVSNLAVDLRDGLRLMKVAEVLTGDGSLLQQARYPCDRKPMQLHNTALALEALQRAGVQLQALPTTTGLVALRPEDIVEGDRERTLSLLWAVARTLQLGSMLRLSSLKAEVQRVLARTRMSGRRPLLPLSISSGGPSSSAGRRQQPLAVYMHDELLSTLQEWVQAVCASYDVTVHNFTTCFGDGVVLCLLVHYYLPNAVDLQEVFITKQRRLEAARASQAGQQQQTAEPGPGQQIVAHRPSCNGSEATDSSLLGGSLTASAAGVADMLLGPGGVAAANAAAAAANAAAVAACSAEGMQWAKGGWAVEFDITGFGSGVPEGDDEAMATARGITANFRTVHRAAEALGCVPEMLSSKDFAEHGPDERTVILYAAFLCSRLLECSRDDRAAHIIQCAWRQRKASTAGMARAHLAKWVAAASLVQRAARAWLLRRRVHEFVLQHRSAAEALQAAWRGWQVRQGLQRQRTACVNVQRKWRVLAGHRAAAATRIQAAWRGHVVRRQNGWMRRLLLRCLRAYESLADNRIERRLAATTVQALWRGQLVRQQLATAAAAAGHIQAVWRGHAARGRLAAVQAAARQLQSAWRARQARVAVSSTRAAALALQTAVRGWRVRRSVEESHVFATILQSWARAARDRRAFLRLRAAAVVLQAAVGGAHERSRLQQLQGAAVALQSLRRGHLVRRQLRQQAAAAAVLQSRWRGAQARAAHAQQHAAAVAVQASWRCYAAAASFRQQRGAATALQALWRGWQVRAAVTQQQAAATVIAAAWRRKVAAVSYAQDVAQVVQLQALVRGRQVQQLVRQQHAAAVTIQSWWRGLLARQQLQQQHCAALALQRMWRGRVQRRALARQRAATTVLQAAVRGCQAQQQYDSWQAAALQLQSSWRAAQARCLLGAHQAAAAIQAAWRRHVAERQLATAKAAAVAIQAAWRQHSCQAAYVRRQRAAVALQAAVRGWQVARQLQVLSAAAVRVQAAWRGFAARRDLAQAHHAAVVLQSAWRCHSESSRYRAQRAAAVRLQAGWRGRGAETAYQQQRAAGTVLQAAARGLAARQLLQQLRQAAAAATVLQTLWRGRASRKALRRQRRAAVILQCVLRGRLARRHVQEMRDYVNTAKELQQMMLLLHTRSRAATTIASTWRGWVQRRRFAPVWATHMEQKQRLAAAGVLQRAWRCAVASAQLRELKAEVPRKRARAAWHRVVAAVRTAVLQQRLQAAQEEAAAVALQAAFRGMRVRRVTSRQLAGVRRFQAIWRGHRVRQSCGRAACEARRRLADKAAAAEAAPHRSIGVRTLEALDVLVNSKHSSQALSVVGVIENSTRYSKACCSLLLDSAGIDKLLTFMRGCNRSKPHVETLGHALACLANICRWPDLQAGLLQAPDIVMVLSERLQMFRDTEDIFMAAVAILSVLVKADEGALHVARSAPGAMKLWEGICQLLARKMDMERKYIERLEGQKGSDVTARDATRKMMAAATQLDALQQVVARIDAIAAAHNIPLVHMARPHSGGHHHHGAGLGARACSTPGGPGAAGSGLAFLQQQATGDAERQAREEHVPRSAAAVVATNVWQPRNTIVRSTHRQVSSQVVAQRAAGPLAAAAAVAPVAPLPLMQSMMAAAAAAEAAAAAAAAATAGGGGEQAPVMGVADASAFGGGSRPGSAAPATRPRVSAVGAASGAPGARASVPRFASAGGVASVASVASTPLAARPASGHSAAGGRVPDTPLIGGLPMMVLEEGALLPEDMLVAAMQQLAHHTPHPTPTPQRGGGRHRSAGGAL